MASERIERLATPRDRTNNGFFKSVIWPIPDPEIAQPPSERVVALSKAKTVHVLYKYPRSCVWTSKTPRYRASERILDLSRPVTRENTNQKQHPYMVSRAALQARVSERLLDLSKPTPDFLLTKENKGISP